MLLDLSKLFVQLTLPRQSNKQNAPFGAFFIEISEVARVIASK